MSDGDNVNPCMKILKELWTFRNTLIIIFVPILFLPVPIAIASDSGRCAYVLLIMAVFWMMEVVPLAVTSLLPIILFPLLGILGSKEVCQNYMKDANVLFMGGLIVAVAVEQWDLHKRIALVVIKLVGTQPRWLMMGFMLVTAFLSMWISNTATTAMMIPIVQAVLSELGHTLKTRTSSAEFKQGGKEPQPDEELLKQGTETILLDDLGNEESEDIAEATAPAGPVRLAIAEDDEDDGDDTINNAAVAYNGDTVEFKPTKSIISDPKKEKEFQNLSKALTICIAFAANIGGTGTLTGTPPNLVLKGVSDTLYDSRAPVSFASWMVYAFPGMLICLILCWVWLQAYFIGFKETFCWCKAKNRKGEDEGVKAVIQREYEKLGPMSFAEIVVLAHFILLAILWLLRDPEFMPGWSTPLLRPKYVTDAATAMIVVMSLFFFPSRRPNFLCCRAKDDDSPAGPVPAILEWKIVQKKLPWDVLILLGGGFALAEGCKASGLSEYVGQQLAELKDIPPWALVLILCCATSAMTIFISNAATATIFLPIVAELADGLKMNPMYFMLPVTVTTSFAFVLPVSTPPNAIVFSHGQLKVADMAKSGIVLNVVCILVVLLSVQTWGYAYFDLGTYPEWAGLLDVSKQTTVDPCIHLLTSTPSVITYAVNGTTL